MPWRPHPEDFVGEFSPAERLGQTALEGGQPDHGVFFGGKVVTGDEHKRAIRNDGRGLADKLQSVELGHVVVSNDHARVERGQFGQGGEWAREGVNRAVEVVRKHTREEVGVGFFVVDENDGADRG